MGIIATLYKKKLITPPTWLKTNVHYETEMGSVAYGVAGESSDIDIYGFCIPPKDMIFPHLRGEIPGFGSQIKRFDQYQQHHIIDEDKEYDITIYSIVKYFQLCMENNPNMIDSLFTPVTCVLHSTKVGEMVRENRKLFLHKGSWYKFRGYAYSQLHKMKTKKPEGKRIKTIEKYGYDVKFAYHVVRLILEVEQILATGTIILNRDREVLKSIRRGEWTPEKVEKWFSDKESKLEELYHSSDLQYSPDESKIKILLLECLEEHYGDLSSAVITETNSKRALNGIRAIMNRYNL